MAELQSPTDEKEVAELISVLSTPTRIGSLYDGNKNRRRSQMFQRQVTDLSFTNVNGQNNNNQEKEDEDVDDEEFEEDENLAFHGGSLGQDLLNYEVPYSSLENVTEQFATMSVRGKRSSNDNEVDKLKKEKLNYQLQLRLLSEFARKVIDTCEHGEEIKQDLINKLENEFLLFNPHCEHCEEKNRQVEKLERANVELDTELRAIIDSFESQQDEVQNLIEVQKGVNRVINSIMSLFDEESKFAGLSTDEKLDQLVSLLKEKIASIKDEKDKLINELTIKLKNKEADIEKNEDLNNVHAGKRSLEHRKQSESYLQAEADKISNLEALVTEARTRESHLNTEKIKLNERLNQLLKERDNALLNQKQDTVWRSNYLQVCKLNIDAFSKFITSFSEILDGESINEAVFRIKRLQSLIETTPNHARISSITSSILRYFNVAVKTIVDQHSQLLLKELGSSPIDNQVHQLKEENSVLEQHVQSFIDQSSTVDELARMRIEELTKKWKNEREARSYENEQARRRLKEVESENDRLKTIIASMRKE